MKMYTIKQCAKHFEVSEKEMLDICERYKVVPERDVNRNFKYDLAELILMLEPKRVVAVKVTETYYIIESKMNQL